ncbi:MAG: MGMT family protein [Candidatus Peregrinibacteria bacterium]|nr:MGMT family protein [Candidatus Peregrinibacteria bacterium]
MLRLLAKIPKGKVTTYKLLAQAMGTRGYRYVGQLLNKNPKPEKYPCFKVVTSDGKLGGFAYGPAEKTRRLEAEGIQVKEGRIEEFEQRLHRFHS